MLLAARWRRLPARRALGSRAKRVLSTQKMNLSLPLKVVPSRKARRPLWFFVISDPRVDLVSYLHTHHAVATELNAAIRHAGDAEAYQSDHGCRLGPRCRLLDRRAFQRRVSFAPRFRRDLSLTIRAGATASALATLCRKLRSVARSPWCGTEISSPLMP